MKDTVIVTGGAGGIGSAIARRFLAGGYRVLSIDTDAVRGAGLQRELGEDYRNVNADVTDPAALQTLAASLGGISLRHIVTLAGRALKGEWNGFCGTELSDIGKSISLNLTGHLNVLSVFLPLLLKTEGDKSVTLVSSVNAEGGFGLPVYSAAKAGLVGFANAACSELGERGVRINAVSPGTVPTEATLSEPKDFDSLKATTALGKFATKEDVAELVFCVAHSLRSVTGHNFTIDAGQTKKH